MSTKVALGIGAVVCLLRIAASGAAKDSPLRRPAEPVVIPGAELAAFSGAGIDELRLWRWADGQWRALPFQVDERNEQGYFRPTEDSSLDDNDELVFLASDLGADAPPGAWPPDVPHEHAPLIIRVTDHLDAQVRFAYLFRSSIAAPVPDERLIEFDAATNEVRSDSYTLGLADILTDDFLGVKRLSLFGGATDLLDRLKLRATGRLDTFDLNITEENVRFGPGAMAVAPPIVGPVRVVVEDNGWVMAYPDRLMVRLHFGGLTMPPEVDVITRARLSWDFSEDALPATYRDANVPAGVPIDGREDRVPAAPAAWREVVFAEGRLVTLYYVGPGVGVPAGLRTYYRDEQRIDREDTGDRRSFGDNGIEVVGASAVKALVESGVVLSLFPLRLEDPLSAEQLVEQVANPLQVSVTTGSLPPTATPSASATPSVSSPTATAEATEPPAQPAGTVAYLPHILRQ